MRILTYQDLRDRGLRWSRVHLQRMVRAGGFPAPFLLSPKHIAWQEDLVMKWLEQRARIPAVKRTNGTAPRGTVPRPGVAVRRSLDED
jgi:predicted DNA-binding transcriptional regulator AlpA